MRNYLENFIYRFRIKSLSGVKSVSVKGRLKNSLEEHRKILESLKEHDALKAERRIKKHIDNTMKNILENLLNAENENS
jgi:DNA-binding GntR family transcriptional regulator